MRHYPDIHAERSRSDRIARLFELHHQQARQSRLRRRARPSAPLAPEVAGRLMARAEVSLRNDQSVSASGPAPR